MTNICFQSSQLVENKANIKLRGGSKVKIFNTDNNEIEKLLGLFRSLELFESFGDHSKCQLAPKNIKESLCSFCLLRSVVLKSKISQGRQVIKPVEMLCNMSLVDSSEATHRNVEAFIEDICSSFPRFHDAIVTNWHCTNCKNHERMTNKYFLSLNEETKIKKIEDLLELKTNQLIKSHKAHCKLRGSDEMTKINLNEHCQVLMVNSRKGMEVNLTNVVKFGGNNWRCRSILTETRSIFKDNENWIFCENKMTKIEERKTISNVLIAFYEKACYKEITKPSENYCYKGDEIKKLTDITATRRKDRHVNAPKRREDRHTTKADRHVNTSKRREDRHTTKADRHTTKDDRHVTTSERREYQKKLSKELLQEQIKKRYSE